MQDPASSHAEPEPGRTGGSGSRAIRNTALVLSARVASRLLALVTVIAMGNHLRPAGLGQFQVVVNSTAVVTVFLDLGFNTLYVREAARHPGEIQRFLQNLLSAKLALSVVCLGILAGVLWAQGLGGFLVPGFMLMVLTAYSNLLRGTLYAVQDLGPEAIAIVLESALLLGLVLLGIATRQGVAYFLWAYAVQYGFSCLFFGIVLAVRRRIRFAWRVEWALLRSWFWAGLPFALTFVLTTLYFKIDAPILRIFKGDVETGWYSFAYKPFEAILFLPMTMLNVVFPVLSVYHREAPDKLKPAVDQFFKALVLLGWPLTVGTCVLTPGLNGIFRLFPQSEPALRILGLGIVFMFASNAFIAALNAVDKQRLFTWAALISLGVNLALNFALIPTYGYLGASWATVLTEVGLVGIGAVLVARTVGAVPVHRLSWRAGAAALVMGAAILPFRDVTGWRVLLVIALGAAVYAGAAYLVRAVGPADLALARSAISGGRAA